MAEIAMVADSASADFGKDQNLTITTRVVRFIQICWPLTRVVQLNRTVVSEHQQIMVVLNLLRRGDDWLS